MISSHSFPLINVVSAYGSVSLLITPSSSVVLPDLIRVSVNYSRLALETGVGTPRVPN